MLPPPHHCHLNVSVFVSWTTDPGEIEENLRSCTELVAGCAVCVAADGKVAALVVLQQAAVGPAGGDGPMGRRLWRVVERALRLHCEACLPRTMWP
eukprot:SAG22_NODE_10367_length_539_cov_0.940909_1_plen_95_part_10